MSNQSKGRKSLWMGILAAVVVLTMVLCMAGCNNEQAEGTTTAPAPTGDSGAAERIDLYWNMDRAEYDGKSEAGMSSREPAEDGYFHVRFFKDGEILELRVADRKTVNAMEVRDLMGLEFDEDGLVIDIIPVDDLPVEKLAWQFYVQSAGGKLIKANSSASLNGMEILLETNENTGIYDMTGLSGDVGCIAEPMQLDRIFALGNADGEVSHVFIYERPNYMKTHEGECKHCEKTVTWYEWTKENKLPVNGGHYQLMNDLSKVTQASMVEDAKICLDLNGHRVDGNSGSRIYSLHNAGTELAIMDTSEAKTGRIAAHGTGDQGMCVWLRYGVFYLYDGILDGSDATTFLNGPTVNMANNTYFYMYGGELIGGTADTKSNGKGGWTGGVGGTLFIGANSKFVMHDGMIRDGYAKAKITKYDANGKPTGYSCGVGGNIFANTGAVIEMHGGTIRDGRAVTYGNISLGSKAEMTMNAGLIAGGSLYFPSSNGGNIGVGGNANFIMNGGTIRNGRSYNCGGNLYLNGRFQMNDGIITDGKILKWGTNEINDASGSRNVFVVNGDFIMYGGRVAGGMELIDTNYKSDPTVLLVSARSVIFDEDGTGPHVRFATYNGGGNIDFYVGQLHDEAKIGMSAVQSAVFSKPTNQNNADNFVSDIKDADIGWCEDGLYIGRVHCLCSQDPNIADDEHKLGCDKKQHIWGAWASTTSLPNGDGYFYLTNDVTTGNNSVVTNGAELVNVVLDLNGKTVTSTAGRMYSLFENSQTYLEDGKTIAPNIEGEAIHLTLTDTVGTAVVNMKKRTDGDQGQLVWGRWNDSVVNILGGTYNCSEVTSLRHNGVVIASDGLVNMYGGTITGGNSNSGGVLSVRDFNMYGGVIENGTAIWNGGNVNVAGVMNMYGGTIRGGSTNVARVNTADSGYGGNICVGGTLNMYGGVIEDGTAMYGVKADGANAGGGLGGNIVVNGTAYLNGGIIRGGYASCGGNVGINSSNGFVSMDGVQLLDGEAGNGGNLALNVRGNKGVTIKGDTLIAGGTATSTGGNIYICQWVGSLPATVTMEGGIVRDGRATQKGGNAYLGGSVNSSNLIVNGGQILDGSTDDCGGNIHLAGGKNFLVVNGGEIMGGTGKNGVAHPAQNVYSVNGNIEVTGGKIEGLASCNTIANGCTLKISGDAVILPSKSGLGITLSTWTSSGTASFDRPYIQLGELTNGASIAVDTWGYVSTATAEANVSKIYSTTKDVEACYVDGRVFMGKLACICGGTSDIGPCAEGGHKKVAWMPWNGKTGNVNANGNYYLVQDQPDNGGQLAIGNDGRPTTISIDLNGHSLTAGFRLLQLWNNATLNIADHKGGGALLSKGNVNDHFGGIQMLNGTTTVNMYSGKLGYTSGHTTHKEIGLVEANGTFNMYGGEISGDGQPTGTLIRVSGTFNMYNGTVKDGYNALTTSNSSSQGGNFRVGGTLNVYGGTISGGKAQYGGNIAVTGTANISGNAVIKDGHAYTGGATIYPQGGNIYMYGGKLNVNGKVTISGGKMTGSDWMPGGNIYANTKAQITIDGGATVKDGSANDGNNLYLTTDGTTATLKNCTFTNTSSTSGNIMVERGNVIIDGATITATTGYNLRANETGKVANYTFNSGLISSTGNNGNIFLNGDDTFVMNGGTIQGGNGTYGGNITATTSKITINGGTIVGGIAKEGGNIALSGACELTINGGEIKNGQATAGTGGNIIVWDTSKVTLNKGTISGGTCTANGGSIAVHSQATLTINGGTITGGQSGDSGGNIVAYGKVVMTGGTVTNGKSYHEGNGMNISIVSSGDNQLSTLELRGGTIAGGLHFNNYKYNVNVSVSGKPVVDKELATANKPSYSMKLDRNDLNVGTMASGAKIMVSGSEGVFTNAVPAAYVDYFKAEAADRVVGHTDAGLLLGKGMCACGGKAVGVGNHKCETVIWQAWNGTSDQLNTLLANTNQVNVYMTGNATLGSQITTGSKKINIDLNGYNLTNTWRLALLQNGGVIGITDTVGTGKITFNGPNNDHSSILMQGGSTLNIYAGTLTRSATSTNKVQSGGIIGSDATSVVNMYGGTISNGRIVRRNNGATGVGGTGGNVNLGGTFNMWAGTITGGVAVNETTPDNSKYINWAAGGNVFITGSGVFNMYGGTVSNGNAVNEGGNFDVQGTLNVTGGTIIGGTTNGSGGNVFVNHGGKANIGAITISGGKANNGGNIYVSNENGGGKVTLNGTTLTGGTATGNGGNAYFNAGTEHSFTNVNISGGVATSSGGNIYTNGSSNLTINSGTISGGVATGSGGNICTNGSSKLTINSGTISGGTATASQYSGGGNIVMWGSSTVDIKGGTISGGLGKFGGSILADGSTKLNISGGTITGGETPNQGGNILLWGTSKLTITGGTIENGRMRSGGGGGNVCVSSTASMTMTGGIIRNGGLLNADNSVNGGETTSNVAYGGVVDMSGGHIYGCIGGGGTLNLSGSAKIYHVRNNQNYYQDNNLCLGGKIFIGQLNSDAVIGVMTTDSSFAANTDTNLTKPFATVNSGVSVNVNQFYGRTVLYVGGNWVGSSDYKVVLNSGKLYLVPTT